MVHVNWHQELILLISDAEYGNGMNKIVLLALQTMFSTLMESVFQLVISVIPTTKQVNVFHALLDTISFKEFVFFLRPTATLQPTSDVQIGTGIITNVLLVQPGTSSMKMDNVFLPVTSAKLPIHKPDYVQVATKDTN